MTVPPLLIPVLAAALFCAAIAVHAATRDTAQPINIRAHSVDANEKTGVSVYRGNVVMTQGTLRLNADRVEVHNRDGRVERVRAWGEPARLQTRTDRGEELRGRAARIEYHAATRRIDLYGSAELNRNDDVFRGNVVHYAIDDQTFSAEGKDDGQVSAVIQPTKPAPAAQ
ncbi:MAG: lipopolysaccharide transport periplasmic protein LptA [Sulfurifustaceae bacterium]